MHISWSSSSSSSSAAARASPADSPMGNSHAKYGTLGRPFSKAFDLDHRQCATTRGLSAYWLYPQANATQLGHRPEFLSEVADSDNFGWPALAREGAPGTSSQDDDLLVYISIDKAGSSSIRRLLSRRANTRLEPVAEYRSSWNGQCPPTVLKYSNLCEVAQLHGTWPDACWHVNRGAVVMDSRLGFCSQGHGRACKYLVVLREPVARLVSSYNYVRWLVSIPGPLRHAPSQPMAHNPEVRGSRPALAVTWV